MKKYVLFLLEQQTQRASNTCRFSAENISTVYIPLHDQNICKNYSAIDITATAGAGRGRLGRPVMGRLLWRRWPGLPSLTITNAFQTISPETDNTSGGDTHWAAGRYSGGRESGSSGGPNILTIHLFWSVNDVCARHLWRALALAVMISRSLLIMHHWLFVRLQEFESVD